MSYSSKQLDAALRKVTYGENTVAEVAHEYNIPEGTIRNHIKSPKYVVFQFKQRANYSKGSPKVRLDKALSMVKSGVAINVAARKAEVPRSTLGRRCRVDNQLIKASQNHTTPIEVPVSQHLHSSGSEDSVVVSSSQQKSCEVSISDVSSVSTKSYTFTQLSSPSLASDNSMKRIRESTKSKKKQVRFDGIPNVASSHTTSSASDMSIDSSCEPSLAPPKRQHAMSCPLLQVSSRDSMSSVVDTKQQKRVRAQYTDTPNVNFKYCPLCKYKCEYHLGRHILNCHKRNLQKPVSKSAHEIAMIVAKSSKNGSNMIPMREVSERFSRWWADDELRRSVYDLCNLARMKVYGGSWELDDIQDYPDVFDNFVKDPNDIERACRGLSRSKSSTSQSNDNNILVPTFVCPIHWSQPSTSQPSTSQPSTSQCPPSQPKTTKTTYDIITMPLLLTAPGLYSPESKIIGRISRSELLKNMADAGLDEVMNHDTKIMQLFSRVLHMSHPNRVSIIKHYLDNVGRMLSYAAKRLSNEDSKHWSDLLQSSVHYVEFLHRRMSLGQTKQTSVSYLKCFLLNFMPHAIDLFPMSDVDFPKDHKNRPDKTIIGNMKLMVQELNLYYKGMGKLCAQEKFNSE